MPIQELTAIESSQTVNEIDETTTDLLHCHLDIVEKHDGDELNEDLFPLIDSLFDDLSSSTETNVNADVSEIDDPPLHAYTSVKTLIFCRRFLSLIRESKVCKTKSNLCLKLIHSILPQPNHLPTSMENVFTMLDVDNTLFHKRVVCTTCHNELSVKETCCSICD